VRRHICSKPLIISFALLTSILFLSNVYAGDNDEASLVLDFKTTGEDSQFASTIDSTPDFVEVDVDGETRTRFTATLVLKSATNLMGVNCDLIFDNTKLKIVDISESKGDLNFDGRENIADILTLAERFGESTTSEGMSYFDLDSEGDSVDKIDDKDIEVVASNINQATLFWTCNPNSDLSTIRESGEIFESPEVSNQNGKIDDIITFLLSRIHPTPVDFGFDGDARIVDIVFEVISGSSGETTISFEDAIVIDEATEITQTEIINSSTPKSINSLIILP
jgi:hypothetical protein